MDKLLYAVPVVSVVGLLFALFLALKLAKVFVKIATVFGIIDSGDLVAKITDFISGLQKPDTTPETTTAVVAA